MDPAQKKWLTTHTDYIGKTYAYFIQLNAGLLRHNISDDDFIYKILHSTGLIFGFPGSGIFAPHPMMNEWSETDRAKIFLTESLLACHIFSRRYQVQLPLTQNKFCEELELALESIHHFYTLYNPYKEKLLHKITSKIFRTKQTNTDILEEIIDARIKSAKITDSKFWHGSQFNVFAFLDIIFYFEWLNDCDNKLYKQEALIQLEILKAIALSIQNSGNSERVNERSFFNYFLENTANQHNLRKLDMIENGNLTTESLVVHSKYPYILKTTLFEYGFFIPMLDQKIDEAESRYIDDLAKKLKLDTDQKEVSFVMVNSFIYKNLDHVSYLKNRKALDIIGNTLYKRLSSIIIKNRGKIGREINESKELAELIWKSKNTELTDEEKAKVKNQLTDIFLKTIPSLAIFMIPGGTIILPLLLKIIPEEILMPSSFRNK